MKIVADIPAKFHEQVKQYARQQGVSMAELIWASLAHCIDNQYTVHRVKKVEVHVDRPSPGEE